MAPAPTTGRVKRRGKLFQKYVVLFVAVVTGALLANGCSRRRRRPQPRALVINLKTAKALGSQSHRLCWSAPTS